MKILTECNHTFSISSCSFLLNPLAESSLSRKPEAFFIEEKRGFTASDSASESESSASPSKDKLNLLLKNLIMHSTSRSKYLTTYI